MLDESSSTPQPQSELPNKAMEPLGEGRCFAIGDRVVPGQLELLMPVVKDDKIHTLCLAMTRGRTFGSTPGSALGPR